MKIFNSIPKFSLDLLNLRGASVAWGLFVSVFLVSMLAGTLVYAQNSLEFEEITKLRMAGKYDEAFAVLENLINTSLDYELILKRSYNELIFTYMLMGEKAKAEKVAEDALRRFPDLSSLSYLVPVAVNDMYDDLRARMFGSLSVVAKPPHSEVFLDGEYKGTSPLTIQYIPVGSRKLDVKKDGYNWDSRTIHIKPNRETLVESLLKVPEINVNIKKVRFGVELSLSSVSLGYDNIQSVNTGWDKRWDDSRDESSSFESYVTFSFGAFLDLAIHPRIILQPGLRYVCLGDKSTPVSVEHYSSTVSQKYLTVPILMKFFQGKPIAST